MNWLDAALLAALRKSNVHLPGGELATLLHTDREAVVQRIADLRAAGFEIDERPALGYRLVTGPDRLIADDLRARLGPSRLVREIVVLAETDSTNTRAAQLGENGAAPGVVVFAECQTAGRGRFGRRWESAKHAGLWFSLLLRPDLPLADWPRLTTWVAVSVADAIEQATGLRVSMKWPNDLEIDGRKFAGILVEMAMDRAGAPFAVAGIGINVNQAEADFPESIQARATSLRLASRRLIDRPALAADVLQNLEGRQDQMLEDFATLVSETRRRSSLLGRRIGIAVGSERVEGVAEAIDDHGLLVLRLADGASRTFGAGEASILSSGC
jgi:BirA family biotin operon repressor/biotin-[acetyl-CoA-carboxylase] ligase